MPAYKLVYFDGKGRAELARLLFVAAGQKYEDQRVTDAEWKDLKPKTPLGALPLLYVDGNVYCQSMAIARYLADKYGLAGKNESDKLLVSEVLEAVSDIRESIYRSFDLKTGGMNVTEKLTDDVQAHLVYFLNKLKANAKNGFIVGDSVTVADFAVFDVLELMINLKKDILDKPERAPLQAHKKKISELPKIKEYLATRPNAAFGF